MGLTAGRGEPVSGLYYQADLDFQVRAPLIGKTFALSGQAALGHFGSTVLSGDTGKVFGVPVVTGNSYSLNIYGAELIASLQDPTWTWAVRVSMVIPDSGFKALGRRRRRPRLLCPYLLQHKSALGSCPIGYLYLQQLLQTDCRSHVDVQCSQRRRIKTATTSSRKCLVLRWYWLSTTEHFGVLRSNRADDVAVSL